jgi:hypothetical protein
LMEWIKVKKRRACFARSLRRCTCHHCCIAPAFTMVDVDKETNWFLVIFHMKQAI